MAFVYIWIIASIVILISYLQIIANVMVQGIVQFKNYKERKITDKEKQEKATEESEKKKETKE